MEHVVIFSEESRMFMHGVPATKAEPRWTKCDNEAREFVGEAGIDEAATIASKLAARGYSVSIVTL